MSGIEALRDDDNRTWIGGPFPDPTLVDRIGEWSEVMTENQAIEAAAFGVFASGAMRAGATLEQCRATFGKLPVEDRARWLQRGRDTITYALGYVS